MSRWQEERGTIHFTAKGYKAVLHQFKALFNARQAYLFSVSQQAHKRLLAIKPGLRKACLIGERNAPENIFYRGSGYLRESVYNIDRVEYELIAQELLRGKDGALCKPRARAFPSVQVNVKDFSTAISPDATLTLEHKTRTLTWRVTQGDRSVSQAKEGLLYNLYFDYLKHQYAWCNAEGGVFHLDEESLSDNDDSSVPQTNISEYWGPVGKKQKDAEEKAFSAYLNALAR